MKYPEPLRTRNPLSIFMLRILKSSDSANRLYIVFVVTISLSNCEHDACDTVPLYAIA